MPPGGPCFCACGGEPSPDCPNCCRYRARFLGDWSVGDPSSFEFTVTISGAGEYVGAIPGPGYTFVPWPQLNGTYVLVWNPIAEGGWSPYLWNVTVGNITVGLRMYCHPAESGQPALDASIVIQEIIDGVNTAGLSFTNLSGSTWSSGYFGGLGPYGEATVSLTASDPSPEECCYCQERTIDTIEEAADGKHYLELNYSPADGSDCEDLAGQFLLLRSGDTYTREDRGDGITVQVTIGDPDGDPFEIEYSSCLYTVTIQSRWISSISITDGTKTFSASGGSSGVICKSMDDGCGTTFPSVGLSGASVWLQPEGSLAESVTVTFFLNVVTELGPSTWEGSGELPLFSASVIDGYVIAAAYRNTLLTQIPLSKTSGDSPYVGLAFVGAVGTGSSQGSRFVVAGDAGSMSFEGYGSTNATSGSVTICPQSSGVRYVSGGTVTVG